MKDETGGVAVKEFVRLKAKMYLLLVDGYSKHKKAKDVNRNVVATISYNEYKDVLMNNKYLRYSMDKIHKIKSQIMNL